MLELTPVEAPSLVVKLMIGLILKFAPTPMEELLLEPILDPLVPTEACDIVDILSGADTDCKD